jgi:hypothetical protein
VVSGGELVVILCGGGVVVSGGVGLAVPCGGVAVVSTGSGGRNTARPITSVARVAIAAHCNLGCDIVRCADRGNGPVEMKGWESVPVEVVIEECVEGTRMDEAAADG